MKEKKNGTRGTGGTNGTKAASAAARKFRNAKKEAVRFAAYCDLSAAKAIQAAEMRCLTAAAIVCVGVRDSVERAQVIGCLSCAAALYGVNFSTTAIEDIAVRNADAKGSLITIVLSVPEGK